MKELKRLLIKIFDRAMFEIVCIEWEKFFYILRIKDGIALSSKFSRLEVEEVILTRETQKIKRSLERYFNGKKVDFKWVKVNLGEGFQRMVLEEVRDIRYGEIKTYGEIASKLKTSPRVVGMALKLNKVPVIIPCHRVVAVNGIGGYSEGLNIKRKLLTLEGSLCVSQKKRKNSLKIG